MGILRSNEDSRPLVHNKSSSITSSDSIQTISDGYVNEAICDSEKLITSRFGDSCKSLFNRQTFQMHYPLASLENAIPLTPLKHRSSQSSPNVITTAATVHAASDKSSNFSYNYNDSSFSSDFEYNNKKSFESAPSSPTTSIPPILPLRNDALSLTEQTDLKGASWFQAGLPREISLEILSRQSPGAFLVRQSESKMGCFALSLRVHPPGPKVQHYLIIRTQKGYMIKVRLHLIVLNVETHTKFALQLQQGFTKEFSSLRALITHHSVMKELLPIPLYLPRIHEEFNKQRHDLDDLEDNLWYIK